MVIRSIDSINIILVLEKRHFVEPKHSLLQQLACKWFKIKYSKPFFIEIDFRITSSHYENFLTKGDLVRFDNGLQSIVVGHNNGIYKCFFFEYMPVYSFDFEFKSVQFISHTFSNV